MKREKKKITGIGILLLILGIILTAAPARADIILEPESPVETTAAAQVSAEETSTTEVTPAETPAVEVSTAETEAEVIAGEAARHSLAWIILPILAVIAAAILIIRRR